MTLGEGLPLSEVNAQSSTRLRALGQQQCPARGGGSLSPEGAVPGAPTAAGFSQHSPEGGWCAARRGLASPVCPQTGWRWWGGCTSPCHTLFTFQIPSCDHRLKECSNKNPSEFESGGCPAHPPPTSLLRIRTQYQGPPRASGLPRLRCSELRH